MAKFKLFVVGLFILCCMSQMAEAMHRGRTTIPQPQNYDPGTPEYEQEVHDSEDWQASLQRHGG